MKNFTLKIFLDADNEERDGKANKFTMKNFETASRFFEALSIFGKDEKDIEDKSYLCIFFSKKNLKKRKICKSKSCLNNENAQRSIAF